MQDNSFLQGLWLDLREQWFARADHLDHYHVVWSGRAQTRTLASCNIEKHRVKVARELNYPQHLIWLKPLLYHEMCHAYLGTSIYHNKHYQWHGKAFRTLVQRHPLTVIFERWVKEGGWQLALEGDKGRRQLVGVSL